MEEILKLLFGEHGLSKNANMGNSAQFNSNISGIIWNSTQKNKQAYDFAYDDLNRLKSSDYKLYNGNSWIDNAAYEEKSISYDENGNMKTLVRTGQAENELANYTYNYNGNQLQSLNSGTTYSYDQNGNMTYDGLRGFSISYNNPLNLPQTISKAGESISYIYSANGEKLAKRMEDNKWQYYVDGFVYNDDKSLNYFTFEEGRVKNISGGFSYEYHLKDHLGNTRVAFEPNGDTAKTWQVAEYYPFGSSFVPTSPNNDNKYLYNGKEKQDDVLSGTNLDWYDYGARFYDPQIGRFTTQDAFAEKYYPLNPYQYVANNPVLYFDINGDSIDLSRMSEKESSVYQKKINELKQNSSLFNATYSYLKKSKNIYPVQFGETSKNSSGESVDGDFVPSKNGGGTITLLKGKEIQTQSLSEEVVHAFQNENKSNYNDGEFNIEFEAKVLTTAICLESGDRFGFFGGMEDFQNQISIGNYGKGDIPLIPKTISSTNFLIKYKSVANEFAQYNRINNVGNIHYRQSTTVTPYSLLTIVKKVYDQ